MARRRNQNTWKALKESRKLQERHVQMAIDLGMTCTSIQQEFAAASDRKDLLLLEWLEDCFFAKHGHYSPACHKTPDSQEEHPAENSLLPDPFEAMEQLYADSDLVAEDDEADFEQINEIMAQRERETPVSYGEIHEEDQDMLKRQADFRKAAHALAKRLAAMPEV